MSVLELVPGVVFTEARDEHQTLSDEERRMRTAKHDSRMKELADTKVKCSLFSLFLTLSLPISLSLSLTSIVLFHSRPLTSSLSDLLLVILVKRSS